MPESVVMRDRIYRGVQLAELEHDLLWPNEQYDDLPDELVEYLVDNDFADPVEAEESDESEVDATDAAVKLAAELDIDLANVAEAEGVEGRVGKPHVERYAKALEAEGDE